MIKDILTGKGEHKFELYFHFAPMDLKRKDELGIATENKNGVNIIILPLETAGVSMEIEKGLVSYSYGRKVEAPIVRYFKKCSTPTSFCTIIYPYKAGSEDIGRIIEKVQGFDESLIGRG